MCTQCCMINHDRGSECSSIDVSFPLSPERVQAKTPTPSLPRNFHSKENASRVENKAALDRHKVNIAPSGRKNDMIQEGDFPSPHISSHSAIIANPSMNRTKKKRKRPRAKTNRSRRKKKTKRRKWKRRQEKKRRKALRKIVKSNDINERPKAQQKSFQIIGNELE